MLRSCHVERHPAPKHNFLTLQPEPECRTPLNPLQTRFVVRQKSTSEHTKYPTYRRNQGRWMGEVSKLLKRNGPSSFTGILSPVNWSATAFARCDAPPQQQFEAQPELARKMALQSTADKLSGRKELSFRKQASHNLLTDGIHPVTLALT